MRLDADKLERGNSKSVKTMGRGWVYSSHTIGHVIVTLI